MHEQAGDSSLIAEGPFQLAIHRFAAARFVENAQSHWNRALWTILFESLSAAKGHSVRGASPGERGGSENSGEAYSSRRASANSK